MVLLSGTDTGIAFQCAGAAKVAGKLAKEKFPPVGRSFKKVSSLNPIRWQTEEKIAQSYPRDNK